eukprot:tig00020614_g12177.t1
MSLPITGQTAATVTAAAAGYIMLSKLWGSSAPVPPKPVDADEPPMPILPSSFKSTLDSLRTTFLSGKTRSLDWRRGQLAALKALVSENASAIVEAVQKDLRRSELATLSTDIGMLKMECDYLIKNLAHLAADEPARDMLLLPASCYLRKEPLGVCCVLGAWNFPFLLTLQPVASAIAAGNCVVCKPSEVSEHSAALMAKLLPRYMDRECIKIVSGGPAEARALCALPWDHIFFTGGSSIGREVYKAAAENLVPVTLELGGKNPVFVDATASIQLTARRIAWGRFVVNTGQICIAPDYVLVHESKKEELIAALKAELAAMLGTDPKASPDYGRMVSGRHLARLRGLVDDPAVKVELGGEADLADLYLAPTILSLPSLAAAAHAKCMQEEIFGPVLPVIPVPDLDTALRFVNGRPKPLAAYVFSEDRVVQQRFVNETSSGATNINDVISHVQTLELPFGGVGASGMGSYHGKCAPVPAPRIPQLADIDGYARAAPRLPPPLAPALRRRVRASRRGRYGFDCFTHKKPVLHQSTRFDIPVRYPPVTEFKAKVMKMLFG